VPVIKAASVKTQVMVHVKAIKERLSVTKDPHRDGAIVTPVGSNGRTSQWLMVVVLRVAMGGCSRRTSSNPDEHSCGDGTAMAVRDRAV
jgi:hypothetical protein